MPTLQTLLRQSRLTELKKKQIVAWWIFVVILSLFIVYCIIFITQYHDNFNKTNNAYIIVSVILMAIASVNQYSNVKFYTLQITMLEAVDIEIV